MTGQFACTGTRWSWLTGGQAWMSLGVRGGGGLDHQFALWKDREVTSAAWLTCWDVLASSHEPDTLTRSGWRMQCHVWWNPSRCFLFGSFCICLSQFFFASDAKILKHITVLSPPSTPPLYFLSNWKVREERRSLSYQSPLGLAWCLCACFLFHSLISFVCFGHVGRVILMLQECT